VSFRHWFRKYKGRLYLVFSWIKRSFVSLLLVSVILTPSFHVLILNSILNYNENTQLLWSYLSRCLWLFSMHYFSPSTRSSTNIHILQIHSSFFTRVCRKEVKFFSPVSRHDRQKPWTRLRWDISPIFCQLKRKSKRRKFDIRPNNLACTSIPDKTSQKIDAVYDIRGMGLCVFVFVCVLLNCTNVQHCHLRDGAETSYRPK
jgi:hypothetical protein